MTLQDEINKLLTEDLIKQVRNIAKNNLDNASKNKETGDLWLTRLYCQSFLDALIVENYVVTIENNNISIKLKK